MEAVLKGQQEQVKLQSNIVRLGRATDNDIVLQDPKVSSHHAEIRLEGQQYRLIDLGSKNGTFINNKRLSHRVPHVLNNFDQLFFGDTEYTFEVTNTSFSAPTMYAPLPSFEPTILAPPPSKVSDAAQQQGYQGGQSAAPAYEPTQRAPISSGAFSAEVPPKYKDRQQIPDAPEDTPSPPKRKSGGKGKIVFALISVVLVLIAGFFVFNFVKGGPKAPSGPAATLDNYCNALKSQQYAIAYNLLDDNTKGRYSLNDFTLFFNGNDGAGKVKNCGVGTIGNASSPANVALNFTYDNSTTRTTNYTLVGADNDWKIINEKVSSPDETLTTYCRAIGRRDFRLAYNQFASSVKAVVSEKTFVEKLNENGVTSCQATKARENGPQATSTVTYVGAFGVTRDAPTVLANEQGIWKIQEQEF